MPACFGASGSVRRQAQRGESGPSPQSRAPCVPRRRPHLLPGSTSHLLPSITHSSPSRPRVLSDARSEPEPGSLKSWHHDSSPRSIGSRNRFFCSSVPWAMSVGPAMSMPTMKKLACTSKCRSSSDDHAGLDAASGPARRTPPASAAPPSPPRTWCAATPAPSRGARRRPRRSWRGTTATLPSPSPRRLATDSSHARASARIAASAGVSSTSMTRTGSSFGAAVRSNPWTCR